MTLNQLNERDLIGHSYLPPQLDASPNQHESRGLSNGKTLHHVGVIGFVNLNYPQQTPELLLQ